MRYLALALLCTACTSGPAVETDDTDTIDTDTTDTETTDTEVTPVGSSTLEGAIVNAAGAAIDGARVQFCRGANCLTRHTDATGTYAFEDILDGPGSFEIIPPEGTDYAIAFTPIDLEDDATLSVDVTMLPLGAPVSIPATAAELEITDGVYVTLGEGELEPPLFVDDATEVAGVDATATPMPVQLLEGTVLAMYYLAPFDFHATAGAPIELRNDWGLADGEAELYVAVYETSTWDKVGDLTVSGDRLVSSGGLHLISTIAVVRKL